jgi:hypothetical protein
MDSTTLLIILIVLLVIGTGGFYGRGRWFTAIIGGMSPDGPVNIISAMRKTQPVRLH